jgi:hypothetical protein
MHGFSYIFSLRGSRMVETVWVQSHGVATFFSTELVCTSSLIGIECNVVTSVIGHPLWFRGGEERVCGGTLAPDNSANRMLGLW